MKPLNFRKEPSATEAAAMKKTDEYKRRVREYIGHPCRVCKEKFTSFKQVERAVTMTQDGYLFLAHADCYNKYVQDGNALSPKRLT